MVYHKQISQETTLYLDVYLNNDKYQLLAILNDSANYGKYISTLKFNGIYRLKKSQKKAIKKLATEYCMKYLLK